MELTLGARDILNFLVGFIRTHRVEAGHPENYVGYKEIHDALHLPMMGDTYGTSLSRQGLADLAVWARDNGFPAITGLVVDTSKHLPGPGYWTVNSRNQEDYPWWKDEITKALVFDWGQFLPGTQVEPQSTMEVCEPQVDVITTTPCAADIEEPEPPLRVPWETYRILRDTELARRIKSLHRYECQICGQTIALGNAVVYAEAHHIRPLGPPHNGPDTEQNIICVCPNHHVQLDYGGISLDIDNLANLPSHKIGREYVEYHNTRIVNNEWAV